MSRTVNGVEPTPAAILAPRIAHQLPKVSRVPWLTISTAGMVLEPDVDPGLPPRRPAAGPRLAPAGHCGRRGAGPGTRRAFGSPNWKPRSPSCGPPRPCRTPAAGSRWRTEPMPARPNTRRRPRPPGSRWGRARVGGSADARRLPHHPGVAAAAGRVPGRAPALRAVQGRWQVRRGDRGPSPDRPASGPTWPWTGATSRPSTRPAITPRRPAARAADASTHRGCLSMGPVPACRGDPARRFFGVCPRPVSGPCSVRRCDDGEAGTPP